IDFEASPFVVNQSLRSWEQPTVDGIAVPRIAGISSFGAGGSNAHMIVEEYREPLQQLPAFESVVILLSARTAEQLQQKSRDLLQYVRARLDTIDLAAMAYTLQVGRDAMEERLGLIVSSAAELAEKLEAYVAGEQGAGDVYRGRVQRNDEALSLLSTDADLQQAIEKWLGTNKVARLLDLWAKGLELDWRKLYREATPRRISLPVYPFARERYWIDSAAGETLRARSAASAALHPLLHRNTSNLSEQRFVSSFSGDEFFLDQHRVRANGADAQDAQKVLPGVAYLEMARAAIEQALPESSAPAAVELRNVAWIQPLVVTGETRVTISLVANDDDAIDFEIYSGPAGEPAVHCQGQALVVDAPAALSLGIDELRSQMTHGRTEPATIYSSFAARGLDYGDAFQGITAVDRGTDQLLAHIRLPKSVQSTSRDYVLHPSVIDSALQASAMLFGDNALRLPFALDSLRMFAPCTEEMSVWVRHSSGSQPSDRAVKLDLDLCDRGGNVCVQMRGFSLRVVTESLTGSVQSAAVGALFAVPVWEHSDVQSMGVRRNGYAEEHVILCELDRIDAAHLETLVPNSRCVALQTAPQQTIAERYSHGALTVFAHLRAIFERKPEGDVLVQVVVSDRDEHALFAGLSGLLRTAARENPQLAGQLIIVSGDIRAEELGRYLRHEKTGALEPFVRYEHRLREVLRWREDFDWRQEAPVAFNDSGVYLITGGTGALGALFAREILNRTREAKVVLTGRSPLSPEKAAFLDGLSLQPGRVTYQQVDLGHIDRVTALVEAIREQYGRLDGILHSAGMITDNFILRKSDAEFRSVLEPKVDGTYNLDQATQELELDFFVLFSSFAGAMGNVGQADYAAANGFMDQFAAYRNRQVMEGLRHGRTLSIQWPLWRDGGMQLDAATQELLEQTTGMLPMQTATGLQAFHHAMALPHDRALVIEGEVSRIRRLLSDSAAASEPVAPPPAAAQTEGLEEKTLEHLRKEFATLLKLPSHKVDPHAALENYGIDSVLAMKLTNHLEKTFGSLPKTLFFEYQSIQQLAGYFLARHATRLNALLGTSHNDVTEPVAVPAAVTARQKLVPSRRFAGRSAAPAAQADPIAIIGLSGRYPEALDLEEYWTNLREGRDCIIEVPAERWDWKQYFSEDRTRRGHHYSKWGGFISGVDEFDPLFFNISPAEAELIDPQERLFLQHAWKAIEDAGYTRAALQIPHGEELPGAVGVYAGVMWTEYQLFGADASARGKRLGVAGTAAGVANRVSYALNLHGPSVTLDTMCSSSLTAIHFACQDLKLGRTSMAIAGGVNVSIHPNKYLVLSAGQFISSDGHCQSFGEGGDGYIPGEGVGVVVLKRLSEAQRDGDHIYGIIRGSALNHGGKTNGYTVPNPQAQSSAIGRVMAESRTDPRHVSYVEAHGTGTRLGDPIEVAALTRALQGSAPDATQHNGYCLIGSAKSNIGHAESAAGIAGLTKVLLQMQHQQIVPSLHSAQLNPHIDFDSTPFVVNQSLKTWEQPVVDGRTVPRIAGISSFGAGGSNAHMIVEEYPAPVRQPAAEASVVILLSARTAVQLQQKVQEFLAFLRPRVESVDLSAVAYTLQIGREAMDERLGFVVSTPAQLLEKLEAYLSGDRELEEVYHGSVKRNKEALSLFSTDGDLQQTVDKWLASRKTAKLLELWVKGL
ncbi:MAG TPA: SDR family NAD(P)-dependent oxidoreductase, partial [Thermoanaerobaculia bacterium]